MKEEQIKLLQNLKSIKDYWVSASLENLTTDVDEIVLGDLKDEYQVLREALMGKNLDESIRKVQNSIITGVIHSILVMIDGGDALADEFNVDLVMEDNGKSLKNGEALHEEFIGYLLDNE